MTICSPPPAPLTCPRRSAPLVAVVLLAVLLPVAVSRAEQPAAATAAEAKAFAQQIPGTNIGIEMVPISGGVFTMGSPDDEEGRHDDEGPRPRVEVAPFYMGRFEVTQEQYEVFLNSYDRVARMTDPPPIPQDRMADAVTYPTPFHELEAGPVLERMGRRGQYPAVIMSVYAAKQYTKWLSKLTGRFYRLPTEAEWEYACRAGTDTAYSFGNDPAKLDEYGWFYDNSELNGDAAYRKVGQKKPNAWGLYDMHGNVAELVLDGYGADWYAQLKDAPVKGAAAVNWPAKQYPRVARGGGFESEAVDCRSAARRQLKATINNRDPNVPRSPHWYSTAFTIGFRIVSPAEEPPEAEKAKYWDADDPITKKILKRDREVRDIPKPPAAAR